MRCIPCKSSYGRETLPKKKYTLYNSLMEKEKKNIQKTRKYFSHELEFWNRILDMLYDALKSIVNSYSEKWPHSKRACLFILPRLIISTKASLEMLTRGYYFDYVVIERSLMESVALLALFSKNEEEAKNWLKFKEPRLPKWKLMHRLFTSPPTKRMIKLVNKAYAEQSQYTHSSFIAVFREFARQLDRKKRILSF